MRKKIRITLFIFFFLALIIFALNKFTPFSFINGAIQQFFSSPLAAIYRSKIGGTDFSRNDQLEALKQENKKLTEKLIDFEKIKKDNDALRSQFENSSFTANKLLPADVTGFIGQYFTPDYLIINKGESDGVKVGMAVIFEKNMVGKIDKVSKNLSQVIVPTNKKFSIIGKTLKTDAVGVVQGEDDFILFDKVVITDTLENGDFIITKGEIDNPGSGVPNGIIVGKINSINKSENKSFQNAKVSPMLNFGKLYKVFIVKSF